MEYIAVGIILAGIGLFVFLTKNSDKTSIKKAMADATEVFEEEDSLAINERLAAAKAKEEAKIPELTEVVKIKKPAKKEAKTEDLSKMSKSDLLAKAKKDGVKVSSRMKKADIIAKLK